MNLTEWLYSHTNWKHVDCEFVADLAKQLAALIAFGVIGAYALVGQI